MLALLSMQPKIMFAEPTTISPYAKGFGIASAVTLTGTGIGLYKLYLNNCATAHKSPTPKNFKIFVKLLYRELQNPQTRSAAINKHPLLVAALTASTAFASSAIVSQFLHQLKKIKIKDEQKNRLNHTINTKNPEIREVIKYVSVESEELTKKYQALLEALELTKTEQLTQNQATLKTQAETEDQINKLKAELLEAQKQLNLARQEAAFETKNSTEELLKQGVTGVAALEARSRIILDLEHAVEWEKLKQQAAQALHEHHSKKQAEQQADTTASEEEKATAIARLEAKLQAIKDRLTLKLKEIEALKLKNREATAAHQIQEQALHTEISTLENALHQTQEQVLSNQQQTEEQNTAQATRHAQELAKLQQALNKAQADALALEATLKQQIEAEKQARLAAERELAKVRLMLENAKKAQKHNRKEQSELEKQLADAETLNQELQRQREEQQTELNRLNQVKTILENLARSLQQQIAETARNMLLAQNEHRAEQERTKFLQDQLERTEHEFQERLDEINEIAQTAKIEELNASGREAAALHELQQASSTIKQQLQTLEQERQAAQETINALHAQKDQQTQLTETHKAQVDALEEQRRKNDAAYQQEKTELNKEITKLNTKIARLTQGIVRGGVHVLGDLTGAW